MIIEATTSKTREQILPFSRVLSAMDELRGRSSKVLDVADLFSKVEEERGRLLVSGCGQWVWQVGRVEEDRGRLLVSGCGQQGEGGCWWVWSAVGRGRLLVGVASRQGAGGGCW